MARKYLYVLLKVFRVALLVYFHPSYIPWAKNQRINSKTTIILLLITTTCNKVIKSFFQLIDIRCDNLLDQLNQIFQQTNIENFEMDSSNIYET